MRKHDLPTAIPFDKDICRALLGGEILPVWSKNSNGLKWRGLGFCTGSLLECASPIQKQRLQSRFHEVRDYKRVQDALGAPARLCHRNQKRYPTSLQGWPSWPIPRYSESCKWRQSHDLVNLSYGSGPGGRWFKSTRPDQLFWNRQLTHEKERKTAWCSDRRSIVNRTSRLPVAES